MNAQRPVGRPTRRQFLQWSALAAGSGLWGIRSVQGRARSVQEEIRFACIGVGGKGSSDTDAAGGHGIVVGLCDIDDQKMAEKAAEFPKAKQYYDFRKMLDELDGQIDAVTVSTPDHTHAPAAIRAMRQGLHCFCQKPLTWSVGEAKLMRELAAEKGLATQMGNQGTAQDGFRAGAEILMSGALGDVKEMHVWTNRPIWPQGQGRPTEAPKVPKSIHWDEFLGPAPERPYHPSYHPFNWRGWLDYGTGALGDMACHTLNVAFLGLDLVDPLSVECTDTSGIVDEETYPLWSIIRYEFGARNGRGPLTLYWYSGGEDLPTDRRPFVDMIEDEELPESGLLIVGEKGKFFSKNDYGAEHVLLPRAEFADFVPPSPTLPRSPGHFTEFARAIKGGPKPMSNFDYAGKLTETVLLGVVALKAGTKVEWDPAAYNGRNVDISHLIHRDYRKGWEI